MKGVCVLCNKEFIVPPNSYRRKYCSSSCRIKSWKVNHREQYLTGEKKYNHKHYVKSKPVNRRCPVCHIRFLANIHNPYQTFCSLKCFQKWNRFLNRDKIKVQKKAERIKHKQRYKDSNDFYHNKNRFGGNRYLALERDGYKCVWCGRDRTEVRLVVHHKDGHGPRSKTPNHELINLVTLCRSCHRKAHDILAT